MRVRTGLERLLDKEIERFEGMPLGIVSNATSVDTQFRHSIELLHRDPRASLVAIFGPQHGLFGETQDNMVEWEGYRDPVTGLPIYSLYGETRVPTPEMLDDVSVVLFDIQDVGARYYTFIYTMAHVMMACQREGKKIIILDRPNPIGGVTIEGNILHRRYASFVGMFPICVRHGMTVGELALLFNHDFGIEADLEVLAMEGWQRSMFYDQTGIPWIIPSPNMPTLETAIVYPGMCLLEGTNLSEGRGTTRPFEIFGAPFIEPNRLCDHLSQLKLPGVRFRAVRFRPTFQKFKGVICGGCQIHVVDRAVFKPFLSGVAIIRAIRTMYPDQFRWRLPPYEYEYEKLPIDILAGCSRLRRMIDEGVELSEIEAYWKPDEESFADQRKPYLLYQ